MASPFVTILQFPDPTNYMAICGRLSKPVGQQLAELPVDPRLGAALLASGRLGCSEEVATVVAMLGVHSVWAGARGERKALEAAKAKCDLSSLSCSYTLMLECALASVPLCFITTTMAHTGNTCAVV